MHLYNLNLGVNAFGGFFLLVKYCIKMSTKGYSNLITLNKVQEEDMDKASNNLPIITPNRETSV